VSTRNIHVIAQTFITAPDSGIAGGDALVELFRIATTRRDGADRHALLVAERGAARKLLRLPGREVEWTPLGEFVTVEDCHAFALLFRRGPVAVPDPAPAAREDARRHLRSVGLPPTENL
jgi:hypothetical protein